METTPTPPSESEPTSRKFRYDKLVRDKVLQDMLASGDDVEHRKLSGAELLQHLKQKLLEEASELDTGDREEALKELADLQEIIDTMTQQLDAAPEDIKRLQAEKTAKAGGFKNGSYVGTVEVSADDPWMEYLLTHPDRYPEVQD